MYFHLILCAALCLMLAGCGAAGRGLRPGDLIFLPSGESGFSRAISASTSSDCADFIHVGIIDVERGDTVVIEAVPSAGVVVTPLCDFFDGCATATVVMVDDPAAAGAPQRARACIGLPYDWSFAPDNGAVYCSELVQLSYIKADGSPLFATMPMDFLDDSGHIPQFWLDLYARQGRQVPHAAPGSSPNSIFRQCARYKKTEKSSCLLFNVDNIYTH